MLITVWRGNVIYCIFLLKNSKMHNCYVYMNTGLLNVLVFFWYLTHLWFQHFKHDEFILSSYIRWFILVSECFLILNCYHSSDVHRFRIYSFFIFRYPTGTKKANFPIVHGKMVKTPNKNSLRVKIELISMKAWRFWGTDFILCVTVLLFSCLWDVFS